MARIIYKDGCEGQSRLECIEGIEIDLLNGQKALIYPKYAECALLEGDKGEKWDAYCFTSEIEALKAQPGEAHDGTLSLYELGSPAAKHVRQFTSDKHGSFYLPTLLAAMEICDQRADIDYLARTIEGADLLLKSCSGVWSSCRCFTLSAWFYNGYGFAYLSYFCYRLLAVPSVLLDLA